MQKFGGSLLVLALCAVFPGLVWAQQSAAGKDQRLPAIVANRSEVLFDMVVTDRHGRVVKTLRPGDVQVLDNGVPQKITSFHLVSRSVHLTPQDLLAAGAAPTSLGKPSLPAFNLITLVFGAMDTGGRKLAREAAEAFIRNDLGPNDYVAIYTVDSNLYILQGFTRDRDRTLEAVQVATGGSSTQFGVMNQQTVSKLMTLMGMPGGFNMPQDGSTSPSGFDGGGDISLAMAHMEANALHFAVQQETAEGSRRMLFGLEGIVQGEALLPGRKSVLYFTQQIPVSADSSYVFRNLTADANRANVTFYVIDPSGLTQESDNAQSAANLALAAGVSETEQIQTSEGVDFIQADNPETVENTQYSSRHMMMALASQTGGLELANTNDLRPWMKRIERDIQSHYELSYSSTWGDDGKFHAITVKLTRPHLRVRARNGYYALPPLRQPVQPFEAPLFAVEHITPAPDAFPLQQTQWIDPQGKRSSVTVATEFSLRGFTFRPRTLPSGAGVQTEFSAMYLVEDMQGNIIKKASQDFPLSGPPSLQKRHMIFERRFSLPAGMYHLRTIVFDPVTSKSTLQTTLINIPAPVPGALRLSSVAVVGRTEPATVRDPLSYQGTRFIPAVSDPFIRSQANQIALFFKVYPGQGPAPRVDLLFRKDGKLVARSRPTLGSAGAGGAIPVFADFPLSRFAPGQYEVDVVARADDHATFQSGFFSVQ